MKYSKFAACLGILFVFLSSVSTWTVAQRYTVTDLGALSPIAVNSWAQVVGNYNGHAFIWARTQGLRDLGLLPGGTFSSAAAINDLGIAAGNADGVGTVVLPYPDDPKEDCSNLVQPFVWTARNGIKGLGTIGGSWDGGFWCDTAFYATDLNLRGEVVGDTGFRSYSFAFSWTNGEGFTLFGGSWPTTAAYGINDAGKIVGQNTDWLSEELFWGHATWWKNGVPTDLGSLGGGPEILGYSSAAMGVNNAGQVVGWSTTGPESSTAPATHAVFWTENGVIRDLGTLPGDTDSTASKINLFGIVIGRSGDASSLWTGMGRPFLWTQGTGMRDLNTLIPQNSGWLLQSANDINVWGQIVGQGTRYGQTHGYLLTPLNPFQVF